MAEAALHLRKADSNLHTYATTEHKRPWVYAWSLIALLTYFVGVAATNAIGKTSEHARALLAHAVAPWVYEHSAGGFLAIIFVTLLSLLSERSQKARQLRLLAVTVMLLAFVSDISVARGSATIWLDWQGKPVVLERWIHWITTTPLMVGLFLVSTELDWGRATLVLFWQASAVSVGFASMFQQSLFNRVILLAYALLSQGAIVKRIDTSLLAYSGQLSDQNRHITSNPCAGLRYIGRAVGLSCLATICVYCAGRLDWLAFRQTEVMLCATNFIAKALLSTSVIYQELATAEQLQALLHASAEAQAHMEIEALVGLVKQKENFLATVSHVLRTPLTGIMGLSEVIQGTCTELKKAKALAATIRHSSSYLLNTINDILDATALQNGSLILRECQVDLLSICADVIATLSETVKSNVIVSQNLDSKTPKITGDATRITQVVYNLVGNALKFTHEGTVTVICRPVDENWVNIVVKDTGVGIPEGKHQLVFEPFQQAYEGISRKYGGTGLGLALTKALIAAHGGTIELQSTEDKGTIFVVSLPIKRMPGQNRVAPTCDFDRYNHASYNKTKAVRTEKEVETGTAGQGDDEQDTSTLAPKRERARRINSTRSFGTLGSLKLGKPSHFEKYGTNLVLVVDDDKIGHSILSEVLEPVGYKVVSTYDAMAGLKWLNTCEALPDIVLLDYMMPDMNGLMRLCKLIREMEPQARFPIVMMSATSSHDVAALALEAGCDDYVRKPVSGQELLVRIEGLLHNKDELLWLRDLVATTSQQDNGLKQLVHSILPAAIVERIVSGQKFIADSHPHVVILFSDIVGFTPLSTSMPTAEMFLLLTNLFEAFDALVDKHGVYKVETIGDAYMVAAGHDEDDDKRKLGTPVQRMLLMANDMLETVSGFHSGHSKPLEIRIGMHCGPAFSGVIGKKAPRYCFLGDTVNTASRMESNGFPMTVHVSSVLAEAGDNPTDFVCMGTRPIKGKGMMRTYLAKVGKWESTLQTATAESQTMKALQRASSFLLTSVGPLNLALSDARKLSDGEGAEH